MSPDEEMRAQARAAMERALSAGLIGIGAAVRRRGRLLQPVPVHSADYQVVGWVAGFAVDAQLAGLVQLAADMRFHRFASFQRRPDSLDGCPEVGSWFDDDVILARAGEVAPAHVELSRPVLSFDHSPDRLVWRVAGSGPAGENVLIFVAGDYAYLAAR